MRGLANIIADNKDLADRRLREQYLRENAPGAPTPVLDYDDWVKELQAKTAGRPIPSRTVPLEAPAAGAAQ